MISPSVPTHGVLPGCCLSSSAGGGVPLSESAQQRVAVGDEWTHYSLTGLQFVCGPPLRVRGGLYSSCLPGGANRANALMLLPCYRGTAITGYDLLQIFLMFFSLWEFKYESEDPSLASGPWEDFQRVWGRIGTLTQVPCCCAGERQPLLCLESSVVSACSAPR